MLVQILDTKTPLWACFCGTKGEPVIMPVVCLGTFQVAEDRRTIIGFIADGHIGVADTKPNFVQYLYSPDVTDEVQSLCRKRFNELQELAKHPPKIIVPNKKELLEPIQ